MRRLIRMFFTRAGRYAGQITEATLATRYPIQFHRRRWYFLRLRGKTQVTPPKDSGESRRFFWPVCISRSRAVDFGRKLSIPQKERLLLCVSPTFVLFRLLGRPRRTETLGRSCLRAPSLNFFADVSFPPPRRSNEAEQQPRRLCRNRDVAQLLRQH